MGTSPGAGHNGWDSVRRRMALAFVMALGLGVCAASSVGAKELAFDFCPSGAKGGQCSAPQGIAVNEGGAGGVPAGTVYVADSGNTRVQSFDAAGNFIRAWGTDVIEGGGAGAEICEVASECKAGVAGGAGGELRGAGGIAVNQATGNVYVLESGSGGNARVQSFDATGHFIRAWGQDVIEGGGGGFEICEAAAECKRGTTGGAAGAFAAAVGITVDGTGDVYVADLTNFRVQKFDAEGNFLATGGTDVDSAGGTGYEVCTVAANCKVGVRVTSGGPFSLPFYIAASSAGDVYVSDTVSATHGAIRRFDSSLVFDSSFGPALLDVGRPLAVAVDPASESLLVAKNGDPTIYEVDPASEEVIEETDGGSSSIVGGLAADGATGELYASPGSLFPAPSEKYIRAYDLGDLPGAVTSPNVTGIGGQVATLHGYVNPVGTALTECAFEYTEEAEGFAEADTAPCAESPTGTEPVPVHADLEGLELGTPYRFRLVAANAAGRRDGKAEAFQTVGPRIVATWSESVAYTEAKLRAEVDPEGKLTVLRFEYGLTDAYGSTTAEIAVGEDSTPHTSGASLSGLQPAVAYHYRAIAESADGTRIGPDQIFSTYRRPAIGPCPNDALRGGPGAALPDCRGYELVSPVDKGGGEVAAKQSFDFSREAAYRQASVDGESATYTSDTAFGDAKRSTAANQYLSSRVAGSWSTHGLNPPQGTTVFDPGESLDYDLGINFLAFSPDLCLALLRDHNLTPLDENAIPGFTDLYQRQDCLLGTPGYEAITRGVPPLFSADPKDLLLFYATYSADGEHAVFGVAAALDSQPEANTNNGTNQQLYEYDFESEGLSLVSVLPSGEAAKADSALGSAYASISHSRESPLAQAVSTDGSRIFWTGSEGKLFVRVNGTTTLAVSGLEAGGFLTAATDGSVAIYRQVNDLFEYNVDKALASEPGATTKIAGQAGGVVGASEDLSRLYFTSKEALATGAVGGQLNLYLREEGGGEAPDTIRLVAVLDVLDGSGSVKGPQIDSASPFNHAAYATPDGRHLTFMSVKPLTGYDNQDASTGEPVSEIFRYDAEAGEGEEEIVCVSCNPSEGRPQGRLLEPLYGQTGTSPVLHAAAWLPTREWANHAKRVLRSDGARILFNAYDALVPRDTNGAQDVYQWEAAGTGGCEESSPSYSPSNEGCIDLISTGQSPQESELLDASASGNDVFFTTASSIDPRDPGSIDLYDARVGGGTAPLPPTPPPCLGDACSPAPPAPGVQTPASSAFRGPGNLSAKPKPRKCPKGKHRVRRKGKARCVPKSKRAARAAHSKRGTRR